MGSNQSQRGGHRQRSSIRDTATTYSDMSTVARQKRGTARILLERKCRFLGRFYAKELSEANLSRLRNHIRLTKGQKTKLRLTTEGIGSGSKLGTILKNKLPAEFTPLRDIIDIFTDNRFNNILCIAMKFPDGNYEIQAYRMYDDATARQFQYAYSNVCDRLQSGHNTSYVYHDHNTSGQWGSHDNWMLRDDGYHSGEMTSKRNGLRKTTSLYDAFDATDSTAGARYSQGHTSSVSPDMGFTSAKGNIGKKLADVSARDFEMHTFGPTTVHDDDSLSQGSDDSNEELRWRLHNLSREVDSLKATMDDKHSSSGRRLNTSMMNGYVPRDDGRSKHYVLTHHRDLDDRWSDDGSEATLTDGHLVDGKAGTVKARVADYRYGNTNQSNSHALGTASSKIGQARRMNGHISKMPSGEHAHRVNNDPNHLIYMDDVKEVRKIVPVTGRYQTADPYRGRVPGRARSAEGHRPGTVIRGPPHHHHHRTPSEASFHAGSTLASARISRPVEKIYLPTGGGKVDYYVINPSTGPGKQKYANSVIGAPRYDRKTRKR